MGVKVIQWHHFDPEHLSVMMVEADPESVRDLLMEDGFTHWCGLRIYPVTPTEDIIQRIIIFRLSTTNSLGEHSSLK